MSNICSHIFKKNLHLCTIIGSERRRRSRQIQIMTIRRRVKKAIRKRVSADAFFCDGLLSQVFLSLFSGWTSLLMGICSNDLSYSLHQFFRSFIKLKYRRELVCGGAQRRRTRQKTCSRLTAILIKIKFNHHLYVLSLLIDGSLILH